MKKSPFIRATNYGRRKEGAQFLKGTRGIKAAAEFKQARKLRLPELRRSPWNGAARSGEY